MSSNEQKLQSKFDKFDQVSRLKLCDAVIVAVIQHSFSLKTMRGCQTQTLFAPPDSCSSCKDLNLGSPWSEDSSLVVVRVAVWGPDGSWLIQDPTAA